MTRQIDDVEAWLRANPGREFTTREARAGVPSLSDLDISRTSRDLRRLAKYGWCVRIGEDRVGSARTYKWRSTPETDD